MGKEIEEFTFGQESLNDFLGDGKVQFKQKKNPLKVDWSAPPFLRNGVKIAGRIFFPLDMDFQFGQRNIEEFEFEQNLVKQLLELLKWKMKETKGKERLYYEEAIKRVGRYFTLDTFRDYNKKFR